MTAAAILATLSELFAPLDEKIAADNREWGKRRRDNVKAKRAELNARALGQWNYYDELFKAAGGKGWFRLLDGATDAQVVAIMDKNTAATAAARNATIAAKLGKAGVTSVVSSEFAHSNDGFDGVFIVNTDAGRKVVKINTIYAGGYNIQCLHLRVLVKIK
jgi:hypothetical protein